jgi:hypothetical protein
MSMTALGLLFVVANSFDDWKSFCDRHDCKMTNWQNRNHAVVNSRAACAHVAQSRPDLHKSRQLESDETSVADVDLLDVFRNSKGPVTVVRNRKDGKLIVRHEAPTQETES